MATIEEQIKSLEDEISKTKYNKVTQGHIGKLKAKIAALKARKEKAQALTPSRAVGARDSKSRNLVMRRLLWLDSRALESPA
ncbi:MAG: hypothetical protein CM1200mP21_00230 [Candidatus Poseidoniales archaeon]|nr:MAG: hypothetical protein CM1200mP21_00230 [Candidatus Poseidoniales archaeon]